MLVWRNYMKGRREKQRGSPSPAMARGMTDRMLGTEDILHERIFMTRSKLPSRWDEYYRRLVETRGLANNRAHDLSYAF